MASFLQGTDAAPHQESCHAPPGSFPYRTQGRPFHHRCRHRAHRFLCRRGRPRLRELIAELQAGEERLATTEAARNRAAAELEAAGLAIAEAQAAVAADRQAVESAVLVEDILAGRTREALPVADAQVALSQARRSTRRSPTNAGRRRRSCAYSAACGIRRRRGSSIRAQGIEALFAELQDCYARIRGLRRTFLEMHRRALMPQPLMDRWQARTWHWDADGAVNIVVGIPQFG